MFYLRQKEGGKAKEDFEKVCNGGLEAGCDNFKLITGYKPSEKVQFYLKKAEDAFITPAIKHDH